MSVAQQAWIFLYACVLGIGFGAVYDVFRILRLAVPTKSWMAFLEDVLFFVIAASALFLFLVHFCYGYFRLYVLLGAALGFSFYFFTVGLIVIGMAKKIISAIKWFFSLLYRIFIWPFQKLVHYINKKAKNLFGCFSQKAPKDSFAAKFYLKDTRKMMYNMNKHTHDFGEGDILDERQKEQSKPHR